MNITSAQYVQSEFDSSPANVRATIDGITMFVPLDPSNRHYSEIMRQIEAGELVIQEAD